MDSLDIFFRQQQERVRRDLYLDAPTISVEREDAPDDGTDFDLASLYIREETIEDGQ